MNQGGSHEARGLLKCSRTPPPRSRKQRAPQEPGVGQDRAACRYPGPPIHTSALQTTRRALQSVRALGPMDVVRNYPRVKSSSFLDHRPQPGGTTISHSLSLFFFFFCITLLAANSSTVTIESTPSLLTTIETLPPLEGKLDFP